MHPLNVQRSETGTIAPRAQRRERLNQRRSSPAGFSYPVAGAGCGPTLGVLQDALFMWWVGLVVTVLMLLPAARAQAAENLIENGAFSGGLFGSFISGWFTGVNPDVEATWSSVDRNLDAPSGSLRFVNKSASDDGTFHAIVTCVEHVVGGKSYALGADVLRQSEFMVSYRADEVIVSVVWVSDPDCFGTRVGPSSRPDTFSTGGRAAWQPLPSKVFRAPAGASSAIIRLGLRKVGDGSRAVVHFDNVFFQEHDGSCLPSPTRLCLQNNRFQVDVSWKTQLNTTGEGTGDSLSDSAGTFWFFRPTNTELFVKVINACTAPFHRYWFFAAGLTNVEATIKVTDTLANLTETYINPLNQAFRPIQDTGTFDTCP